MGQAIYKILPSEVGVLQTFKNRWYPYTRESFLLNRQFFLFKISKSNILFFIKYGEICIIE